MARGGRGGRVVYVRNLHDFDPRKGDPVIRDSLRWALESVTGPRMVLFAVGGTIDLKAPLRLSGDAGSYVTIAGQSAPGDGIQLKGYGLAIYSGAHDVIVRYLRIRPGYTSDRQWDKDALTIYGPEGRTVHDVIVDHCSLEWAIDENANVESSADRITFQYCIFGEGSVFGHHSHDGKPGVRPGYSHSMGFLASGPEAGAGNTDRYLTLHHNLFISNMTRNPQLANAGGVVDCVNNVIYNWGSYGTIIRGSAGDPRRSPRVNLIGNYYRRGPDSHPSRYPVAIAHLAERSLYVRDNIGPCRDAPHLDDWSIVSDLEAPGKSANVPADERARRIAPWPTAQIPVTIQSASAALASVSRHAGARHPKLDAVDARLIRNLADGTGHLGFGPSPADHLPHPVLAGGPAPTDTDGDGMPDEWEIAQGLNPTDVRDGAADPDRDGYTNVEEYLNGIASSSR